MQFHKKVIVTAALAAMSAGAVQAAPQAVDSGGASAQQVRELMDVVGLRRILTQMDSVMVQQIERVLPCVAATTVETSFSSTQAQDDILNRMVPVYQRHFTSADIQGLLTFYRSPLGQKVLREMPATMQEGMQIGRQWGQERAQAMVAQLKQQGVLNSQGACPATQKQPAVPAPRH